MVAAALVQGPFSVLANELVAVDNQRSGTREDIGARGADGIADEESVVLVRLVPGLP